MIKEYDKVRLITGEVVRVVEVLGGGAAYVIEVIRNGGVEVENAYPKDIASVFIETEQPFALAAKS